MKVAMGERRRNFKIHGNPKLFKKALLTFNCEK
jgi:hypothetical protein